MTDGDSGTERTSALEEERLQFYLENREYIHLWAALADEVSDAIAEELMRLGDQVQDAAARSGFDLVVADRVAGGSERAPMLHRASWRTAGADGPDIAVAIGWDGRKVQPTPGYGASLPYVGVLASHATERGQAVEAAVRPLAERELVAPRKYRKGTYWIVYRFIEASDDWYRDVPGWRSSVVEELMGAWRDGADLIEEGLASLGSPAT